MPPRKSRSTPMGKKVTEASTRPFTPVTKNQPEKPVSKKIPSSNKRFASSGKMSRDIFPILDLPDELRLKIYGFILPSKERIFLDHENFYRPLPYQRDSYGDTASLLRVCKKIHYEATEYIFSNNTVNIIKPARAGDFLTNLGKVACEFITKLECHIDRDLGDLGNIWSTMSTCPKLRKLRLVFYHDRQNWHHVATQIAYHVMKKDKPVFELELYDSIWANSWYGYDREQLFSLRDAERHARIYSLNLPTPLQKIVLTASISPPLTQHLIGSSNGQYWALRKTGTQQNGEINTLQFIGTQIGEDMKLDNSDDEDDDESW